MELSKSAQIYDLVVERLVRAEYAFGARIFVKELAAETGASRQPIMSALNRLRADGLVRIVPQVGCEVINPSRSEIADFLLMFQRMDGLLAELAAQRRTEDQLRQLKSIQSRLISIDDVDARAALDYVQGNRVFHNYIHVMAASPLLESRQRSNFNMIDFFINHTAGFAEFMSDSIAEHEPIIQAIEKRQPERARLFAEAHIAAVADSVLSHLERDS